MNLIQIIKRMSIIMIAVAFFGACSSAPKYRTVHTDLPPKEVSESRDLKRTEIVRNARSYIGTPYRSGGTTRNGVDCSGFVLAVFRDFGIPLPRTSRHQSTMGIKIDRSDLRPADLVFFKTSRRTSISHVGIYIGKNRFIHASTRERSVRIDRLDESYFKRRFVLARRIVN